MLKNRLIRAATWEGMADIDGHIPDELYDTYEELAKGGIGAIRADKAEYDGIQIHAAHVFFLSRFISPAYNHRKDGFGGSPQKRGRLLVEIIDGIREKAPSMHITMKINCSDFMRGGLDAQESFAICKLCEEAGIDSIEISGNGTSVPGIKAGVNEEYFKEYAYEVSKMTDIPIILVGGHRSVNNMEKIPHRHFLYAENDGMKSICRRRKIFF